MVPGNLNILKEMGNLEPAKEAGTALCKQRN